MKIVNQDISFCPLPWYSVFVGNKGKYMPCCMNYSNIGNIEQNSIEEVWNNKLFLKIRELIKQNKYEEAGCDKNCFMIHEFKSNRGAKLFNDSWLEVTDATFLNNLKLLQVSINNDDNIALNNPITFDLQPTEQCNMRCIMCNQNHTSSVKVSKDNLKQLFKFLKSLYSVRFQGGEIFVDKQYKELLYELKQNSFDYQTIQVITNGSLLSYEDINDMVDEKKNIKFIVSVDGTTEEVYKKIRRNSNFQKVMSNMKYLSKLQRRYNIKDLVQWNFVVMKSNIHQLKEALTIANDLQIKIYFQAIIGDFKDENIFKYNTLIDQKTVTNYFDNLYKINFISQDNIDQIKILEEKYLNGQN